MAEGSDSREKIIQAAIEVLRERGPAQLSGREVARRAGVSVSLINHHFDGVDGMMEASLQLFFSELARVEGEWRPRLATEERPVAEILSDAGAVGLRLCRKWQALLRYNLKRIAEGGGIAAPMMPGVQEALIAGWTKPIAERTGLDIQRVRLRFHSGVAHIARLATASPKDVRELIGEPHASDEEVDAALLDHVRDLAHFVVSEAPKLSS
ncbi:MAG: TetR/AcrR family transcriptional regulator [Deltaproteobacteria bacterium]|nr:TetR/AcrR family transcriptional regulator [Deltaproteobacteria bacterium]